MQIGAIIGGLRGTFKDFHRYSVKPALSGYTFVRRGAYTQRKRMVEVSKPLVKH